MALIERNKDSLSDISSDVQLVRPSGSHELDINLSRTDKEYVRKWGLNENITTLVGVWTNETTFNFPTGAETIRIKAGGNAADDDTSTGAREVTVEYLDATFAKGTLTLVPNGTLASTASTATVTRILRAWVSQSGTYGGANTGDIVIENTTSTEVLAHIDAGKGQTEQALYTVPLGYTAYITSIDISVSKGNTATVSMYKREGADVISAPFTPKRLLNSWVDVDTFLQTEQKAYIKLPEKTDIWFEAVKVTGGGSAGVGVEFDLILVAN